MHGQGQGQMLALQKAPKHRYHFTKFYSDYNEAGNFSVNSSEKQLNIASTFFLKMQMAVDKPTRLLQFVAFVHLPFSFRSLDLFVASLLFRKGTSFCVIRRK